MYNRNHGVKGLQVDGLSGTGLFVPSTGKIIRTVKDDTDTMWLFLTRRWYPVFDKRGKYRGFRAGSEFVKVEDYINGL